MLAPTEGSQSGVVTGPSYTLSEETLPENACMPVGFRLMDGASDMDPSTPLGTVWPLSPEV